MLFYINIPFKLIVSDALRIAIKHECIVKKLFYCFAMELPKSRTWRVICCARQRPPAHVQTTRHAAVKRLSIGRATLSSTGVNPAGDAGDTSPNILVGGTSTRIPPPQYYYVLSDIKVKVKFSDTRYRALGPELIPVYRQSARR